MSNLFYGVVEDRNDPLKLGRVRVRVMGLHTQKRSEIPAEDLHWAVVGMPATSPSVSGVGDTPRLVEGSRVLVAFLDDAFQHPVVLFSVPGIHTTEARPSEGFSDPRLQIDPNEYPGHPSSITYPSNGTPPTITEPATRDPYPLPSRVGSPDTHPIARNEEASATIQHVSKADSGAHNSSVGTAGHTATPGSDVSVAAGSFSEPANPYDAKYPFNRVLETESGHLLELDDTPGKERIHLFHRSGSFVEMHPDGKVVSKAVNDFYGLKHGNSNSHILGEESVTVEKGMRLKVNNASGSNDFIVEVGSGGELSITVQNGNANLNVVSGDINLNASGNLNKYIGGNVNETVSGNVTRTVTGTYTVTASTINLN